MKLTTYTKKRDNFVTYNPYGGKMRKFTLKTVASIILTLSIFSLGACSNQDKEQKETTTATQNIQKEGKTQELQKITIAQFGHVFVYLPIYIAKEKGFFKDEGLEVKYISTGGDDKTWAAVTSGSAQFGVADPTFVAIAREKGDNSGQIIAGIIDGVPFWGVSKKEVDIKSMQDLDGLRVATFPAPSTNFALMERIVKNNNLNTKIVQGAFGTLLPMVENDRADIAMVLEPTASLAVEQGFHVAFSYKNSIDDFALTGLSTTKNYIATHPDICQKVVNALQRAYKYAYSDFAGTLDVAAQQFQDLDRAVLKLGVERMISDETISTSALVKESSWDAAVSLRKYLNDLQGNAPFSENVDNQFAQKAAK